MVEISRTIAQRHAWYKGRYKKMESKSLKRGNVMKWKKRPSQNHSNRTFIDSAIKTNINLGE